MRLRLPAIRGAASALTLLTLAACGGDNTSGPETPVATSMSITPTSAAMDFIGQTVALAATILDQNGAVFVGGTISWSSDNTTSVSVNAGGVARAEANGSATITASGAGLTATIDIDVVQAAFSISTVSGDDQEAIADSTLTDPVVVVAKDRGGSVVPDVTVTFAPQNGGQVTDSTLQSDTNGEAQTTWTLGSEYGPQALNASIPGSQIAFSAMAWAETPLPDLKIEGPLFVTRPDPTTLETVDATATVRNAGNDATGAGFRMQLLRGGVEVAFADLPALAIGAQQQVTFQTVGPLTQGLEEMKVVSDSDDAIGELIETNNEATRNVFVTEQTDMAAGQPISGLSITGNQVKLFRLTVPPGSQSPLLVTTSQASGDVDLFIDRDERPSTYEDYDRCVSAGPSEAESCQFLNPEGEYQIAVHSFDTLGVTGLTVEATLGGNVLPYNVEIEFLDHGTPSQDQLFIDAAARWNDIIIGDVPDQDFTQFPFPADLCWTGQPAQTTMIDDVLIYVSISFIDGPGQTLALLRPCIVRPYTSLPIMAQMQFDPSDLERLETDGQAVATTLHEMGHALGVGVTWVLRNLVETPSLPSSPGVDTHIPLPLAIQAFDAAGGTAYTAGEKVPVANGANSGSADVHWRESVMTTELMTSGLNSLVPNELSAITIQSLADLGYAVDVSEADPFVLTLPTPPALAPPQPAGPSIDLSNDIAWGPIAVVGPRGRILEVIDPRERRR